MLARSSLRRTCGGQEESGEEAGQEGREEGGQEEAGQEGQAQGSPEEEGCQEVARFAAEAALKNPASSAPNRYDEKETPGDNFAGRF